MADNREYLIHTEDSGSINISEDVLVSIVTKAIGEIEGADSLMNASMTEQLAEQFKGKKKPARGIRVEPKDDGIALTICLMVKYGYAIPEVAAKVQESVMSSITSMTGFTVTGVDVHVGGISFN